MVLPVASLLSVKRVFLSLLLLSNHLGSKLFSNTGRFSTSLPCRLCISVLQLVTTTEGFSSLVQVVIDTPSLAIGPPSNTPIPLSLLRFPGYKHAHTYAQPHTWPHDAHDTLASCSHVLAF